MVVCNSLVRSYTRRRESPSGKISCLAFLLASCASAPRLVTTPTPVKTTTPRAEEPVRESDEYTRYELLAPDSASFHILFEVTAVTPGATVYFNPIRKGSTASGETVTNRASSRPLQFEVVSGAEARVVGNRSALRTAGALLCIPAPLVTPVRTRPKGQPYCRHESARAGRRFSAVHVNSWRSWSRR